MAFENSFSEEQIVCITRSQLLLLLMGRKKVLICTDLVPDDHLSEF